MPNLESLNQTLQSFEDKLSYVGLFPVVSILSGGVRGTLGTTQVIAAIGLSFFSVLGVLGDRKEVLKLSGFYLLHGSGNVARAFIEIVPGTFILLVFYIRKFEGGMRYIPLEKKEAQKNPEPPKNEKVEPNIPKQDWEAFPEDPRLV